jgi:hypothetical protein
MTMKHHQSKRISPSIVSKRKRMKPLGPYSVGENQIQWRVFIDGLNGEERSKLFRLIDRQNLTCEILANRGSAAGMEVPSVLRVIGDCDSMTSGMVILARFLDGTSAAVEPYSEMKVPRNFEDGNCELSAAGAGELSTSHKRFRALNGNQRKEMERGRSVNREIARADADVQAERLQRVKLRRIVSIQKLREASQELCAAAVAHDREILALPIVEFHPGNGEPVKRADCGAMILRDEMPTLAEMFAEELRTANLWADYRKVMLGSEIARIRQAEEYGAK